MTGEKKPVGIKESEQPAFPLFPTLASSGQKQARRYGRIRNPIWSEHKAKFIQQYLRFFVQVTKHGAYIDGFAGPQNYGRPDAWSAALVLESEPKWLRHFFLCEKNRKSVKALRDLKESQPEPRNKKGKKLYRNIEIWPGDFNQSVTKILDAGKITQKEATFCLLDQRMFECHWETLKKLAAYKNLQPTKSNCSISWVSAGCTGRSLEFVTRRKWRSGGGKRIGEN